MNRITFVVAEKGSPDGRYQYAIFRMSDNRQELVSYHETMDEAVDAASNYLSRARYSGLDACIFQRDWLIAGLRGGHFSALDPV